MNNIKQYINEKLKINSKTKISSYSSKLTKKQEEQIIDSLCRYFQQITYYNGSKYDTGLEVLEKYFNCIISNFLDYYPIYDCDKLAKSVNISVDELLKYIDNNNDEIYKEIKDFVL